MFSAVHQCQNCFGVIAVAFRAEGDPQFKLMGEVGFFWCSRV